MKKSAPEHTVEKSNLKPIPTGNGAELGFFDRVKDELKNQHTTIEKWLDRNFNEAPKISRDTYNGWRRRGTLPRLDDAVAIARKLGTTAEYLYDGKDSGLSYEDRALLALARKHADLLADVDVLPPDKLEFIKMQVRSVADFTRQSAEKIKELK